MNHVWIGDDGLEYVAFAYVRVSYQVTKSDVDCAVFRGELRTHMFNNRNHPSGDQWFEGHCLIDVNRLFVKRKRHKKKVLTRKVLTLLR